MYLPDPALRQISVISCGNHEDHFNYRGHFNFWSFRHGFMNPLINYVK